MKSPTEVYEYCNELENRLSLEDRSLTDREIDFLLSQLNDDTPRHWYLKGESFSNIHNALDAVGGLLRYWGPAIGQAEVPDE